MMLVKIPITEKIRVELLEWGHKKFREYPWRQTSNPYHIFVAEILLHRTRADQVVPVYLEVVERFPSMKHLAEANLDVLEKILYPLGLRWRVHSMHKASQIIVSKHNGIVPSDKQELLSLPGIDHYIAGAILCFAFGKPEPLLDTNTVRVIGRLFDIPVNDSSRRNQKFREILEMLINKKRPREFNYAILDFAARVCVKSLPKCSICPLNDVCKYCAKGGPHA